MKEAGEHRFLKRIKQDSLHVGLYHRGKKNGFGVVDYFAPRLLLQAGYFIDNQLNGLGSQIIGEGTMASRYLGSFKNGIPQSFGILATQTSVYRGYFRDGELHGFGILVEKDGCRRAGRFKARQLHGYAEITDGNRQYKYTGLMVDNLQHGVGEETIGKESYQGYFLFGKRQGIGLMKRKQLEYIGGWKEGSRTGFGTEKFEGQYEYFGSFLHGHKEGICEVTYADGTVYIGQIKANRKTGFGRQSLGKENYIGYWRNDKRHGLGFYKDQAGQTFFGQWREDSYIPHRGFNLQNQQESNLGGFSGRNRGQDTSRSYQNTGTEISYVLDDDEATPEFFSAAASRIIEIDQRLTGEKIKINEQFANFSAKFPSDKKTLDNACREIDLLTQNSEKEFEYMLNIFTMSAQKHGIDIFEVKQKLAAFPANRPTRRISEDPYHTPALKAVSRNNRLDISEEKLLEGLVKGGEPEDYFTLNKPNNSEAAIFETLLKDRKDSSHSRSPKHSLDHSSHHLKFRPEDSLLDSPRNILADFDGRYTSPRYKEVAVESTNPLQKENPFAEPLHQRSAPNDEPRPNPTPNVLKDISESLKSNKEQAAASSYAIPKGSEADQFLKENPASLHQKSAAQLAAKKKEVEQRLAAIEASLSKLNAY